MRDLENQIKSLSAAESELRQQEKTVAQFSSRLDLLNTQVNQWQSKSAPRLAEINDSLEGDTFAPEARERLALVNEQLKTIGYDAAAHDSIRKAESEGRVSEGEVRALEKARSAIAPLEREIVDLETQAANQEIEVARKGEEHAAAAEALEDIGIDLLKTDQQWRLDAFALRCVAGGGQLTVDVDTRLCIIGCDTDVRPLAGDYLVFDAAVDIKAAAGAEA